MYYWIEIQVWAIYIGIPQKDYVVLEQSQRDISHLGHHILQRFDPRKSSVVSIANNDMVPPGIICRV